MLDPLLPRSNPLPALLVGLSFLSFGVVSSSADVLALYPFNTATLASTDAAPNSVASNLSLGGNITDSGFYTLNTTTNTTSGANAFQGIGGAGMGGTPWSASLDANQYFSLTLTPDPGFALNLTSLTFFASKNTNGADSWSLRSSLDSFGSDLGSGSGVFQGSPGAVSWTNPNVTFSLTNLTAPIEFRIYPFAGTTGNFRLDDITLNGTVTAVPEPSGWLLGTFAALGLYLRRRSSFQSP